MFVLFPSIKDGLGQGTEPEATKAPGPKHLWVVCLPLSGWFAFLFLKHIYGRAVYVFVSLYRLSEL